MTTQPVAHNTSERTPDIDRVLDAAMRAFLRHGVSRTRIPDIADEAGVSRTTVYRVIGSVERIANVLLERELGRLLDRAGAAFRSAPDWTAVLDVCARVMEDVEAHPLFRKVRDDEPAIIGMALATRTALVIDVVHRALEPSFSELEARDVTSTREHRLLVETLVRLGVTCVLAPPDGGVRPLLQELLGEPRTSRGARVRQRPASRGGRRP